MPTASPSLVVVPRSRGWVNDPNGAVRFAGRYHLYFQNLPGATRWGYGIGWGHATSVDLRRWRFSRTRSLVPGLPHDRDGCFSGNAVVEGGRVWLAYTGVVRSSDDALVECQCLAHSADGASFVKLPSPVLVKRPGSRQDARMNTWRDPYLFRHAERWHMLVATGWRGAAGRILLYRGDATLPGRAGCWRRVGTLARFAASTLECPYIVRMPETGDWVLGASAQNRVVSAPVYWVGAFDGRRFTPKAGRTGARPQLLRAPSGLTLYAATAVDVDGAPHVWTWVTNRPRTLYGPCRLRLDGSGRQLLRLAAATGGES
jgi:sucrose-6-phosphate hydrolase SacC (GH32 family)